MNHKTVHEIVRVPIPFEFERKDCYYITNGGAQVEETAHLLQTHLYVLVLCVIGFPEIPLHVKFRAKTTPFGRYKWT